MPTSHARPRSFTGTLAGGLVASSVILLANQVAERLGVTELDLPQVLGLSFLDSGQDGTKLAGSAWYFLTGGLVVPTLYWLGFRFLGMAGARRGLALGLVHHLASALLLRVSEPECPKRRHGRGRPMGPLLSRYGRLEQAMNLLGHLGYGTLAGLTAARRGMRA